MNKIYNRILFAVNLLLLALIEVHADGCKGCINFDEYSFNKIVPKFKYSLVKYDIAFPYGPKHDAFIQFAETLSNINDLIVADVGIKDYGQKDNEDFAKTQNVDASKLPVIKLYKGIKDSVQLQDEDITFENLRDFVLDNSDIHITLPGCIEVLDKIAMEFIKEPINNEKYLAQIEDYIASNDNEIKAKKTYTIYMKKLLEDGNFVSKEHKRLTKILTEGKVAESKKQDLQHKINILQVFEDKTKTKDKKQEL